MPRLIFLHTAVFFCGLAFGALCMTATSDDGPMLFEKRCGGCHGLDRAKEGPPLRGVLGRPAGSSPKFPYSDALKSAKFMWDEAMLDRWLTDPETLVAGNDMAFRLGSKEEREKIIEYLKGLK